LWGFHDLAAMRDTPPDPQQVGDLLAAMRKAPDYDGGDRYGPAPSVGWDFGGIGKGWIVDAALLLLRRKGFSDAVIDAGGNLAARGMRGDTPWRIGVRDPRSDAEAPRLVATLMSRNEAVNTHGDDQRYFEFQGRRYAHLLDPSTGCPARGLRALTVVHADGTLAEAAGAALYVAGRQRWPQLARKLGLEYVLAVDEAGQIEATSALLKRIRPENGAQIRPVD
jgi:thiamine biosynthesis lipoprotein